MKKMIGILSLVLLGACAGQNDSQASYGVKSAAEETHNSAAASEPDYYAFTQDFELVSANIVEKELIIKVRYEELMGGEPRFIFAENPVCLQSYPAQCFGTVLRLDYPVIMGGKLTESEIKVPLRGEGVQLSIRGPKGKTVAVAY